MQEPITLKVTMTITDGAGKEVANDTLVRSNLTYANLTFIQGKLGGVLEELQKAAEKKSK